MPCSTECFNALKEMDYFQYHQMTHSSDTIDCGALLLFVSRHIRKTSVAGAAHSKDFIMSPFRSVGAMLKCGPSQSGKKQTTYLTQPKHASLPNLMTEGKTTPELAKSQPLWLHFLTETYVFCFFCSQRACPTAEESTMGQ